MDLRTIADAPPWEWPEDTGTRIQQVLIDSRAETSERLLAAEMAGELSVMNDDLAGVLLAIVRNNQESEELRAKAAISLGPVLEYADTDEFEDSEDVTITEPTFHRLLDSLHQLFLDQTAPKQVRRRVLEASVRSPQDWHTDAITKAYASGDPEWMLTAVFSMRWVRGFDDAIMEALDSQDPRIRVEAIAAAGNWQIDGAWGHVLALLENPATPKPLLLAAIEACAGIRPQEALEILLDFADSDDEEIAEVADEALSFAEGTSGEMDVDEDFEEEDAEEDDEED